MPSSVLDFGDTTVNLYLCEVYIPNYTVLSIIGEIHGVPELRTRFDSG